MTTADQSDFTPPDQCPSLAARIAPAQRFMPVMSDAMEPTLRRGDFVAVAPVTGWHCDGLYIFAFHGEPEVFRCSADFRGGVRVCRDNKAYGEGFTLGCDEFLASVAGKVTVLCRVVDRTLLIAG